ncbi:MAG: hypothetical protein U0414_26230 [Polyangiaceae bacterium]
MLAGDEAFVDLNTDSTAPPSSAPPSPPRGDDDPGERATALVAPAAPAPAAASTQPSHERARPIATEWRSYRVELIPDERGGLRLVAAPPKHPGATTHATAFLVPTDPASRDLIEALLNPPPAENGRS